MELLQRHRFTWREFATRKAWIAAVILLPLGAGATGAAPLSKRGTSNARKVSTTKLSPARKPETPNVRLERALRKHDALEAYLQILAGADVNLRIDDPFSPRDIPTALDLAAAAGNAPFTRKALELGAQVEPTDNGSFSPLMLAVASGNPEVVRLLLEAGADYRRTFPGVLTPLSLAEGTGNQEVAQLLRAVKAPGGGETRRFLVVREGTVGTFYVPGYRITVQPDRQVYVSTHDGVQVYHGRGTSRGFGFRAQNADFNSWTEVGVTLIRY